MSKYKVIKEWPGCPHKKGDEFISNFNYINYSKYPEFVEKINIIDDYDYIIVKLMAISTNVVSDNYIDGKVLWSSDSKPEYRSIEKLLSFGEHVVHTVIRKSDNKVFSLDDKISLDGYFSTFRITKFENGKVECSSEVSSLRRILKIDELTMIDQKNKLICVTEDGYNIYEGDSCYWITTSLNIYPVKYADSNTCGSKNFKHFKHYDNAVKHVDSILYEKECLSIKDVLSVTYNPTETKTSTERKLIDLIRKKLGLWNK